MSCALLSGLLHFDSCHFQSSCGTSAIHRALFLYAISRMANTEDKIFSFLALTAAGTAIGTRRRCLDTKFHFLPFYMNHNGFGHSIQLKMECRFFFFVLVAHTHFLGVSRSSPATVGICQLPFSDSCHHNTHFSRPMTLWYLNMRR